MDAEAEAIASSSAAAAASLGGGVPGPIRKRRFSSAKIQPTRVKRVMQSDEDIGRMVASVPVAVGRAMEHFAEKLLEASMRAVQMGSARTLSPMHMKMAMLANPHFKFLEPIMREIAVPGRIDGMGAGHPGPSTSQADGYAGAKMAWPQQLVDPGMVQHLPATLGQPVNPLASLQANFAVPQYPMMSQPVVTSAASISRRRSTNGSKDEREPGEKPKRGRPRKVKKVEKCVDDDDDDELHIADSEPTDEPEVKKEEPEVKEVKAPVVVDKDRELMPPPAFLPLARLANGKVPKNGVGQ